MTKSLLIHVCCAPCLAGLKDHLHSLGFLRIKGFFYNPNIHPYREFKKRRHNVRLNEKFYGFDEFEYSDQYPLNDVLKGMLADTDRCQFCFELRINETAKKAHIENFSHFTSTLLISPFQKQDLLVSIGNAAAEKYAMKFLSDDMRKFYQLSRDVSEKRDMYRQDYCGCIFSEFERYAGRHVKTNGI